MKTSESIGKIAPALIKSQSDFKFAVRDSKNPHLRVNYASLRSVVDAVKFVLNENGIMFTQTAGNIEENKLEVETRLIHTSGEWISGVTRMPINKMDAQGYGASLSYARRYGLAAITGLYQDDDETDAHAREVPKKLKNDSLDRDSNAKTTTKGGDLKAAPITDEQKSEVKRRLAYLGQTLAEITKGQVLSENDIPPGKAEAYIAKLGKLCDEKSEQLGENS